jgi:hypothetical protein
LQGHDIVAEGGESQRHNGQEHHDRAMHRPKGIIEVSRHYATRGRVRTEHCQQQVTHKRDWLAWIGKLPPHHGHERIAEEQEKQSGDPVLEADDFMIGREKVLTPKAHIMMMFIVGFMNVRSVRVMCVHEYFLFQVAVCIKKTF